MYQKLMCFTSESNRQYAITLFTYLHNRQAVQFDQAVNALPSDVGKRKA